MPAHEKLKSLHTALIDSLTGYREALSLAEKRGMKNLFNEMVALRERHASELASALSSAGVEPESDGSFMSAVHSAVLNIRALFGGLDVDVLPGLIDGENRIVSYYDEAISAESGTVVSMLTRQRSEVDDRIAGMEAMSRRHERGAA